jgi:hypothetical protein
MLLATVGYLVLLQSVGLRPPKPEDIGPLFWTIIGWNAVLLVVTVLVIVDSILEIRAGKARQLAVGAVIVKLAAIPFFLINTALFYIAAFVGAMIFLFGGMAFHVAVAIGIGLCYLVVLSTSIYGFASIVQLRREGRIDTVLAVLYTILLLTFVSDVVAAIMLLVHSRRPRAMQSPLRRPSGPSSTAHPTARISRRRYGPTSMTNPTVGYSAMTMVTADSTR